MDNREVLIKLQYTTKYGVQLNSSRVLKNYNLYKHLVLKHIPEQVYIDYSNEDCELVNLKNLLDNSCVISDKKQIESFNNLKQLLYKDVNTQYDLFTLIDNAYNDIFGHNVEKDLGFGKYSYFYKQLLDLSKSLMNKYMQYIGTDDFPKDINQLYIKEFGTDKYNQLIEWLYEPIINDVNINCLINCILNDSCCSSNTLKLNNKTTEEIPLHKNAQSRIVDDINKIVPVKEKVIISKNSFGLYTFKDLVFNLKTSLVIGKWNSQNQTTHNLSKQDIDICKNYNLKYDENMVINEVQTNVNNLNEKSVSNIVDNTLNCSLQQTVNAHEIYEKKKSEMNVNNDKKLKEFFNNLKEKRKDVLEDEEEENEEKDEEEDENKDEPVNNTTEKKENIIKNILNGRDLSLITNTVELTSNLDSFKENFNEELEETPVSNNLSVGGSSEIIPIVNEKVSRGRKKASTITVGTTSLKQKAQLVRKTGK